MKIKFVNVNMIEFPWVSLFRLLFFARTATKNVMLWKKKMILPWILYEMETKQREQLKKKTSQERQTTTGTKEYETIIFLNI